MQIKPVLGIFFFLNHVAEFFTLSFTTSGELFVFRMKKVVE